ncbi:MAG: 30S ribosomal protein S17 [Candidatus Pacebacteria bacterium]|nr:30S ribosomal protein S17 [Candidatus Paceibacterota bacterium]
MPKRQLKGIIVSDKTPKMVVVKVERIKENKKYKKRYRIQKKYKAHYETGEYHIGDIVQIEECRPVSKDKKWKVINKLASGAGIVEEPIEEITEEVKNI